MAGFSAIDFRMVRKLELDALLFQLGDEAVRGLDDRGVDIFVFRTAARFRSSRDF